MDRSIRIAQEMTNNWMHASRSIRAVLTNEDNEFRQALDKIKLIAKTYNIPILNVGGMATIHHILTRGGEPRTTSDIDVLLNARDIHQFMEHAKEEGFYEDPDHAKGNWPHLVWGPRDSLNVVGIDIVPAGAKARKDAPTNIPTPEDLGVSEGLENVCLHGLMELKLSSNRPRDRSDVVALIKHAKPEEIGVCENHLRRVHPDYLDRFVKLIIETREEQQQEEDLEWKWDE